MMADPYKVLGVSPDASDEEIKRAYRTLAKKYHPDANPGDEAAAQKMQEINAAYDQIKNPDKYRQNSYGGQGGYYDPFGGSIKKVILKAAEFTPVAVAPSAMHRQVFERGETPVAVVDVINSATTPLEIVEVEMKIAGLEPAKKKVDLIPAKDSVKVAFELNAYLLEKDYPAAFTVRNSAGKEIAAGSYSVTVVPAPGDALPVVLWGGQNMAWVKDLGFTHQSVGIFPIRGMASMAMRPELIQRLDRMMRHGLYAYSSVVTKYRFLLGKRYLRTNRQGKLYGRDNLEASNPAARAEFAAAAESIAKVIGDHIHEVDE